MEYATEEEAAAATDTHKEKELNEEMEKVQRFLLFVLCSCSFVCLDVYLSRCLLIFVCPSGCLSRLLEFQE